MNRPSQNSGKPEQDSSENYLDETSKPFLAPAQPSPLPRDTRSPIKAKLCRIRKHLPQGWRLGVLGSSIAAFIVLLINLCTTIGVIQTYPLDKGFGTIFKGSCEKTKSLSLWLHLAINGISTVMLSASNYTIQCLISPMRKDIDAAHSKGKWLDIGVPSLRNVGRLPWVQKVLWATLWISSVPLHLMYNSAVFPTISAHSYNVTIVPENTLQLSATELELQFNQALDAYKASDKWIVDDDVQSTLKGLFAVDMAISNVNRTWREYTDMECLATYNTRFPSSVGSVIVVMPRNYSAVIYNSFGVGISTDGDHTGEWLDCAYLDLPITVQLQGCSRTNPAEEYLQAGIWTLSGQKVQRCLVQERAETCTLQFSGTILYIVIICNAVKAVAMLVIFLRTTPTSSSPLLVTAGDAVQSFLIDPDQYTIGVCYAGRDNVTDIGRSLPQVWKTQRTRWWRAISLRRWAAAVIPALMSIVFAIYLIISAIAGRGIKFIWERGFGQIYTDSEILMRYDLDSFLRAVLCANTPQLLLSFLYLMYNSLFTGMVMGQEWNQFGGATGRKYIRVTYPQGKQRGTYWLQLPYRYALPLMACSAFIHWSTSQALFFAQLNIGSSTIQVVGYSILATVVSLVFGGLMLLAVFLFGLRRYQNDMPTVGSCSAAISAACHPLGALTRSEREVLVLKPLQWGDVGIGEEGFRHLAFSDKEVSVPIELETYAGGSRHRRQIRIEKGM